MTTIPRAGQPPTPPVRDTRKAEAPRVRWTPEDTLVLWDSTLIFPARGQVAAATWASPAHRDAGLVASYLEGCGVSASRLSAHGYGDRDQIQGGLAANRRVVITVQTR
jgi:hypothetical protein